MVGWTRGFRAVFEHGARARQVVAFAIVFLFACLGARAGAAGGELLRNGDFEAGGSEPAQWMTVYPLQLAKPAPRFVSSTVAPHAGKRAGSIVVEYTGGYTSFTQSVDLAKGARGVHFEAWARVNANPGGKGAVSAMLFFVVPSHADGGMVVQSKRLVEVGGWTKLTVDAEVPEGATEVLARLGVFGPCSASFDDASLASSEIAGTACKLAVAQGDYRVKAKRGADAAWIALSIPFPIGGQTPLAVRVKSDPPGRVVKLDLLAERENRPLRVHLAPLASGEEVAITVETLTLLRDRPLSDGKGVALPAKARVPKEVAPHLKAAPGVDIDDADVKRLAAGFARTDFQALMADCAKTLREKLAYDGGTSQGAKECLDAGKAVCTGYANVAASLLIAAGVPTRILACDPLGSRLQEHYVVEAWTSALGWSRMESTAAVFPYRDSESLVLRVVYPDSDRSPFDVPLYVAGSDGVDASFRMDKEGCWQGSTLVSTHFLDAKALAVAEEAARARFEALVKVPERGDHAVFAPLAAGEKGFTPAWVELAGGTQVWLGAK